MIVIPALCLVLSAYVLLGAPGGELAKPKAVALSITEFRFSPAELTVARGDTLVWTNQDAFMHTTTADSAAWSSPELPRGARFVHVARTPGRFTYHCAAHPVMRAAIVVRE